MGTPRPSVSLSHHSSTFIILSSAKVAHPSGSAEALSLPLRMTMGSPTFVDIFQGSTLELVSDNPKGHQSDLVPTFRKRKGGDCARTSQLAGPKKKLQPSRWDSSSAELSKCSPTMPVKPGHDSPPSLERMLNPPLACTLHNVLKPVRRLSFEKKLDDICGTGATTNMSAADLLSSVLGSLDLLDEHARNDEIFAEFSAHTATRY